MLLSRNLACSLFSFAAISFASCVNCCVSVLSQCCGDDFKIRADVAAEHGFQAKKALLEKHLWHKTLTFYGYRLF